MPNQNAADVFSRFMVEAYDERKFIKTETAFQAFFGVVENGSKTIFSPSAEIADIDILRGNKKTAALIPRGAISRLLGDTQIDMTSQNFSTFSRSYPLAVEAGSINATQLTKRLAGENPYKPLTQEQRARVLALDLHMESARRLVRMCERLAAQSVLDGVQDAILGTTNTALQYDWRRKATHTITVAIGWNQATAVILANIDVACKRVRQDGNHVPDFLGMGDGAYNAFLNNSAIQAMADNRRFNNLVMVDAESKVPAKFNRHVESGWLPQAKLHTPGGHTVWIFTYHGHYENNAGTVIDYMPTDKAFVASTSARCDRMFGPPEMLPLTPARRDLYQGYFGFSPNLVQLPDNIANKGAVITPEMFHASAYENDRGTVLTVETQMAPIYATTATDSFVTMDGLIT